MDKHVESHGIQPFIGVPSLICDILSVQKKYIVICDDEIGVTPSVFTLSYILNIEKDVVVIESNICAPVDETDLVFNGEILELFNLNLLLLLHKYIVIHIISDIVFGICPSEEQSGCYCNFVVCDLVFLLSSTCAHSGLNFSVTPRELGGI